MKALKAIYAILGLSVVMPIWYYLLYKVLQGVNATEVMWFLYWIYLPVGILVQVLTKIAEASHD